MGIIQIIEDEPDHARLLDLALRRARYRTNTAHDGRIGLADVQRLRPALVLLDVMLPEMDGHEICRRLKADPQTRAVPVIMMSALGTEDHRLKGFELGADDYVTKPFSSKEVVARVHAVLRRTRLPAVRPETYLNGMVRLEDGRFTVSLQGSHVELDDAEWRILRRLARQDRLIVDREDLMVAVWGEQDPVYDHELERLVLVLNQKLAGLPSAGWTVAALPGIGYRLAISGAAPLTPARPTAS